MRSLFLSVAAAMLPLGLSAGTLFSGNPTYSGGPYAGAEAAAFPGGASSASSVFPAQATPTFPGYAGVPLAAIRAARPNLAALNANARTMVKPRLLRHHWAVGVDSIPAVSGQSGSMVAVPSALAIRWWATDRLAVDVLGGGTYNGNQTGKGGLTPLSTSGSGSGVYAGGLGFRYNVSELSHDLLSQIVVKASGAQASGSVAGASGKATETTLAVFVGAGFEAFVPGWDWLSVEASAGVTGLSQSVIPPSGSGAAGLQTLSGAGLAGSGFSPFNVAVHAYF